MLVSLPSNQQARDFNLTVVYLIPGKVNLIPWFRAGKGCLLDFSFLSLPPPTLSHSDLASSETLA